MSTFILIWTVELSRIK